ncbi:hypothetical protein [Alicyclobacillus shizuokensis]|uniref:hypothetical protein n=1 Tax=Alicyclobacillus shizuokensis TaxID=392014 RepID=UPI00082F772E|nr:hypothetical protein [Alicyclobacillus shizuokensis]
MFPIHKKYLRKFRTEGDPYYDTIKKVIRTSLPQIVREAQSYIDAYEQGTRVNYATDIAGIYMTINGIAAQAEIAATKPAQED